MLILRATVAASSMLKGVLHLAASLRSCLTSAESCHTNITGESNKYNKICLSRWLYSARGHQSDQTVSAGCDPLLSSLSIEYHPSSHLSWFCRKRTAGGNQTERGERIFHTSACGSGHVQGQHQSDEEALQHWNRVLHSTTCITDPGVWENRASCSQVKERNYSGQHSGNGLILPCASQLGSWVGVLLLPR